MDVAKTSATSVDRYNPAEGLAKIAQAEGAEVGYRRAWNLEGLRNAVPDKLTHQRNVVMVGQLTQKRKPTHRSATTGKQSSRVGVDGVSSKTHSIVGAD